jgi:aminoglycoside 3-N-acetyltransferase
MVETAVVTEHEIITATGDRPVTSESLVTDLRELGVTPGMVVIVHSSLSRLGWVAGGPQAVVAALVEAVGPGGTIVMPTHTGLTDPARWKAPPVPAEWVEILRDTTPAYDPLLTPTRKMGAVVECFRRLPGAVRSSHPWVSFAAHGPQAERIVGAHRLEYGLGEGSPLARVEELDGWVLLLGVGHGNNTSLHLAELRAAIAKDRFVQGSPMLVDGERRWVTYPDFDGDSEDFTRLGDDFAADTGAERLGPVGAGAGRLVRQREILAYAVGWFERHRPPGAAGECPS